MSLHILNTIKSFVVLAISSLCFVLILMTIAYIGSINVEGFPLEQAQLDNLKLLIPLLATSLILSPFYGFICTNRKVKRLLYLFLLDILFCWLAIMAGMISLSQGAIFDELGALIALSFFMLFAYIFIAAPVLVPATFILNKWTK